MGSKLSADGTQFIVDVLQQITFDRISIEAARICKSRGVKTLNWEVLQAAVKKIFPKNLYKQANFEAEKALDQFDSQFAESIQ